MGTRLGVMGGTFDPIHYGHLVTAEEALQQFELDAVAVRADRPAVDEGARGRLAGRGPLPDDGDRDGVEPAVPRLADGGRP